MEEQDGPNETLNKTPTTSPRKLGVGGSVLSTPTVKGVRKERESTLMKATQSRIHEMEALEKSKGVVKPEDVSKQLCIYSYRSERWEMGEGRACR